MPRSGSGSSRTGSCRRRRSGSGARADDPSFTCANLFWWYNMYSTADYQRHAAADVSRRRPQASDVYTAPGRPARRAAARSSGTFPLFNFWGPRASIESTRWIAEAAKHVEREVHADAVARLPSAPRLQPAARRPGDPAAATDVRQVDELCGDLIASTKPRGAGRRPLRVRPRATSTTPVHINRVLREHGLVAVRDELGLELLDPGASAAFAVADHQVAHVYVNDPSKLHEVRTLLERTPGSRAGARRRGQGRASTSITLAPAISWRSPRRTRGSPTTTGSTMSGRRTSRGRSTFTASPATIPVELFLDPAIRMPALTVGWKLAEESSRIPHADGRHPARRDARQRIARPSWPCRTRRWPARFISKQKSLLPEPTIDSIDVYSILLAHLGVEHGA